MVRSASGGGTTGGTNNLPHSSYPPPVFSVRPGKKLATTTEPMAADADRNDLSLDRYRGYLAALARLQVAARPWLAAKLDASDLVQQTLLKAHAARAEFRGLTVAEFVSWLRQILNRTLANELRAFGQAKRHVGAERSLEADLDASSCRLDAWLAVDQT